MGLPQFACVLSSQPFPVQTPGGVEMRPFFCGKLAKITDGAAPYPGPQVYSSNGPGEDLLSSARVLYRMAPNSSPTIFFSSVLST
jgi:hypothetical protein